MSTMEREERRQAKKVGHRASGLSVESRRTKSVLGQRQEGDRLKGSQAWGHGVGSRAWLVPSAWLLSPAPASCMALGDFLPDPRLSFLIRKMGRITATSQASVIVRIQWDAGGENDV